MKKVRKKNRTFVTFGQCHSHALPNCLLHKDVVAVIECDDYKHGREIAFELFGPKFSTSYFEDEWNDDDIKWFPGGYVFLSGNDE